MSSLIFFDSQDEFYDWLENHCDTNEIWVGYHKKSSGRATLTWSASVDAALCFGWVDGIRKTIDEERYKIRFTPRKVKSVWSAVNVKKVKALIKLGKMKPAGMELFRQRTNKRGYSAEDRNVPLAEEYEKEIRGNKAAWNFLSDLAPSYKRDSIWWVMSAKREETRQRRLRVLIDSCAAGQKIPMLRKN